MQPLANLAINQLEDSLAIPINKPITEANIMPTNDTKSVFKIPTEKTVKFDDADEYSIRGSAILKPDSSSRNP